MQSVKRISFDRSLLLAIVVLLCALAFVLLRGDQLGVTVTSFGPQESSSSQANIQITLDEAIDQNAAQQQFHFDPAVAGTISVQRNTITFRPTAPLTPGQEYAVSLGSGPIAVSGRALIGNFSWHFRIRQPRILTLGPVGALVQNVYAVDAFNPDQRVQLTHSANGVVGYTVATDGSKIIYAEINFAEGKSLGTTQLTLLDTASGAESQLYTCVGACTNLTLQPGGSLLAFDSIGLNENVGTGPGAPRIWLYDLDTHSAHPLFSDSQRLGQMPHWSPDGSQIALYSASEGGLIVHNFTTGQDTIVANVDGQLGSFSPDGKWLYYSKIVVQDAGTAALHLVLLDLSKTPTTQRVLETDSEGISDIETIWRTDSKGFIIARQIPARQLIEGAKVYGVDMTTGASTLLISEDGYAPSNLTLNPSGDLLLFQRHKEGDSSAYPELWLYALGSGKLVRIAQDSTAPAWLP